MGGVRIKESAEEPEVRVDSLQGVGCAADDWFKEPKVRVDSLWGVRCTADWL